MALLHPHIQTRNACKPLAETKKPGTKPGLNSMEATPGFEPGVKALQASALPLGHVATKKPASRLCFHGADDGVRTRDPNLGKVVLYQLSHVRKWE